MRKVWNLANILTLSRIVLSPVFFLLFLANERLLGVLVFIAVAVTDVVDGWVARSSKQVTKFGATWDPMADKVMVVLALLAIMLTSGFPLWGLLILVRDAVSLSGSVLVFKKHKGHWKPNIYGKLTTFLQVVTIFVYMLNSQFFVFGVDHKLIILVLTIILSLVAAVTYAARGIDILRSK
ncbi:MAG: CDP-alcohol phosphatidyltransferase family protein [Nanoarchaeota archaeon]|nr:CDP-alcohol phosphatidyltransferase family protein [Nanoarchaeota archaeon]MBU1703972.1 CDP-alcohol phosphatidyltransferase family protein [Nanoarchaeota archaeon]